VGGRPGRDPDQDLLSRVPGAGRPPRHPQRQPAERTLEEAELLLQGCLIGVDGPRRLPGHSRERRPGASRRQGSRGARGPQLARSDGSDAGGSDTRCPEHSEAGGSWVRCALPDEDPMPVGPAPAHGQSRQVPSHLPAALQALANLQVPQEFMATQS
jgi:hypothetical protein